MVVMSFGLLITVADSQLLNRYPVSNRGEMWSSNEYNVSFITKKELFCSYLQKQRLYNMQVKDNAILQIFQTTPAFN